MAGTAHYDWHYGQLAVEVISFWLWWRERGMENISSRLPAGFWWHIWPPLGSRLTSWLASIQPTERLDHLNRKYFYLLKRYRIMWTERKYLISLKEILRIETETLAFLTWQHLQRKVIMSFLSLSSDSPSLLDTRGFAIIRKPFWHSLQPCFVYVDHVLVSRHDGHFSWHMAAPTHLHSQITCGDIQISWY